MRLSLSSSHSTTSWCLLTLCLVSLTVTLVSSYVQELDLYESENENDEANYYGYRKQNPTFTTSDQINRNCARGWWCLYKDASFNTFLKCVGSASGSFVCRSEQITFGSFRHFGHSDPNNDVINLYPRTKYEGAEIVVSSEAYAVPAGTEVKSLGKTGPSDWVIYREANYTGSPYCFKGNAGKFNFIRDISTVGITKVGSVIRRPCTAT